jgi:hypothetical protein
VFVCVFQHNSGTPGAISTELGTHIAICMYTNLMYIDISPKHQSLRGDDMGEFHEILLQVANRYRGNAYSNRYPSNSPTVCVVLEHTYKHTSIFI